MKFAGIILAAGESSRMGTPKALLEFEGRTFVRIICERMREAGIGKVVAVIGAGKEEIQREADPGDIEWAVNEDYRRGQLSSLWCGLEAIRGAEGAVMTLVDHPVVEAATYRSLIEAFKQTPEHIVIPTVGGRRGHPIVFGAGHFCRFLEAPLDVGARWVVSGGVVPVREIPVKDEGVRADIDTPEDYHRWVARGVGE
ncbi:MAG: nucleotidyltransferase family protein [Candidatus Eisenbacteria sp.]|nr:nucleotidyltransferase family protein [Candidatus Eisenbacteria bacterium]